MIKSFLTLLCFAIAANCFSQDITNLILNPNFEEEEGKLKKLGQIEVAKYWVSPTGANADLFETDHKKEDISAPDNIYGKEKPMSGSSRYAGAVFFSYKSKDPRTYIQTQLASALKKDVKYCVQFHVSLADLSKYAVNNIGAHLSKKPVTTKEEISLILDTHVKHSSNKIYNEQYMWEPVCGVYVAQGGEKYLTIGNFSSDKDTEYEKMKKPKEFTAQQINNAYYYIDEVSVRAIDKDSECDCEKSTAQGRVRTKFVYSKQLLIDENTTAKQIIEYSTIYFDFLSNELESASKNDLDRLANVLKDNPSMKLQVVAHTDDEEMAQISSLNDYDQLSKQRAENAISFLTGKGISKDRLEVVTKDDAEPADERGSDLARAKNRRVEFKIK
jgi:OmpA-OmpF porin, OOP family